MATRKCGKCGRAGHNRQTCKRKMTKKKTTKRKCGKCGRSGHNMTTCSNKAKKAKKKKATKKTSKKKKTSKSTPAGKMRLNKCPSCQIWTSVGHRHRMAGCSQCGALIYGKIKTHKFVTEEEYDKIMLQLGRDWRAGRGAAGRLQKKEAKSGISGTMAGYVHPNRNPSKRKREMLLKKRISLKRRRS